jgi:hypothetical protein
MVLRIGYSGRQRRMQGLISSKAMIFEAGPMPANTFKDNPVTREYETRAKNLLKGELKRRGLTYAQLAERLAAIGVQETERNLNNKISRGGFSAAFLLQVMEAIEAREVRL